MFCDLGLKVVRTIRGFIMLCEEGLMYGDWCLEGDSLVDGGWWFEWVVCARWVGLQALSYFKCQLVQVTSYRLNR